MLQRWYKSRAHQEKLMSAASSSQADADSKKMLLGGRELRFVHFKDVDFSFKKKKETYYKVMTKE